MQNNMKIELDNLVKSIEELNSEDGFKKSIFDIDNDKVFGTKYNYIKELSVTLEQFIQRKDNVLLVSFAGDFSTGKSSTINNLLEDSSIRDTGYHPTDNAITLITDINNQEYIKRITTESKRVAIRPNVIESDILKNIVFVDTPGSGDVDVANEVIREFMPLCDFVFYFFHPAHSFDESDMPFLLKKYKELPFLPMKIVITNADLFRKDIDAKLTDENFDKDRYNRFVEKLFDRFKKAIGNFKLDFDDVFLVGNLHNFGIDTLREHIANLNKNIDNELAISMYRQKESYFQRKVDENIEFFRKKILEVENNFKEFIEELDENIKKYKDSININTNTLDRKWQQTINSIEDNISKLHKNSIKEQIDFKNSAFEIVRLQDEVSKIYDIIDELSEKITFDVRINIYKSYQKVLEDGFSKKIELIKSFDKLEDFEDERLFSQAKIVFECKINTDFYENIQKHIEKFEDVYNEIVSDMQTKIKINFSSINSLSNGNINYYIKNINSNVEENKKNLKNSLLQFYTIVELYLKGVLNISKSNVVERLQLKDMLSKKIEVFDMQKKVDIEEKAIKDMYGEYDSIRDKYKKDLLAISNNKDAFLKFNSTDFTIKKKMNDFTFDGYFEFLETMQDKLNIELRQINDDMSIKFKELFSEKKSKYDKELEILKKRKKTVLFALVGGTVLVIGSVWGLGVYYDVIKLDGILSGLVTGGILTAVSFVSVLLKNNAYKLSKKRLRDEFVLDLRDKFVDIIEKESIDFRETMILEKDIQLNIKDNLKKQFIAIKNTKMYVDYHNAVYSLKEIYNEQVKLYNNYKTKSISFLENTKNRVFNTKSNEVKLKKISEEITKYAIEPSYDFMQEHYKKIQEIKKDFI